MPPRRIRERAKVNDPYSAAGRDESQDALGGGWLLGFSPRPPIKGSHPPCPGYSMTETERTDPHDNY
jgi:hypothetical protein